MTCVEDVCAVVGPDSEGLRDLEELMQLAEAYGYSDWLVFAPSVVRGLSYYTGVVFEAFDRQVSTSIIKKIIQITWQLSPATPVFVLGSTASNMRRRPIRCPARHLCRLQ